MLNRSSYCFLVFWIIFLCDTNAQNQINSPYSQFGIGDIYPNVLPEFSGMGGTSIGSYSTSTINPYNPSSFTAFKLNSFIFSTGGMHQTTRMNTISLEQITNYSLILQMIPYLTYRDYLKYMYYY